MQTKNITVEIPSELLPFYLRMVVKFNERVADDEKHGLGQDGNRHWKWISTSELKKDFPLSSQTQIRIALLKMEELGFIHSKRECNWIKWAVNDIEGFRQHQFEDYFCRI